MRRRRRHPRWAVWIISSGLALLGVSLGITAFLGYGGWNDRSIEEMMAENKGFNAQTEEERKMRMAKGKEEVPGATSLREAVAEGKVIYSKNGIVIDATNAHQGYLMIKGPPFEEAENKAFVHSDYVVRILYEGAEDDVYYDYSLNYSGEFEAFPLQSGSGKYAVNVMVKDVGGRYIPGLVTSLSVELDSPLIPFLYPNQQVWYQKGDPLVAVADTLCGGVTQSSMSDVERVRAVYSWLVEEIEYDPAGMVGDMLAYKPELTKTMAKKIGNSLDCAALFTAMMRSQNIPAKLIYGSLTNDGPLYGWSQVYIKGEGWVTVGLYDNGVSWSQKLEAVKKTGSTAVYTAKGQY